MLKLLELCDLFLAGVVVLSVRLSVVARILQRLKQSVLNSHLLPTNITFGDEVPLLWLPD